MRFNFDGGDPQETARAKRCVEDMLRRGYSIFVEHNGKLIPCKGFDTKTCSYIIADGPLYSGDADDVPEPKAQIKKRGRPRKLSAASHKATAVAPTAGG